MKPNEIRATGVYNDFQASDALVKVLGARDLRWREREVLFVGFCHWMCFPDDPKIVQAAILLRAAQIISKESGPVRLRGVPIGFSPRTCWLADEIYAPALGMAGVIRLYPPEHYRELRRARRTQARHLCRVLEIWQFHHLYLRGEGKAFERGSLKKAVEAYNKLFPKPFASVGYTQIRGYLENLRSSLPFLYAGVTPVNNSEFVPPPKNGSDYSWKGRIGLLNRLIPNPRKLPKKNLQRFADLASRAKFMDGVLSKLIPDHTPFPFPEDLLPTTIMLPNFSIEQIAVIMKSFKDDRVSSSSPTVAQIADKVGLRTMEANS